MSVQETEITPQQHEETRATLTKIANSVNAMLNGLGTGDEAAEFRFAVVIMRDSDLNKGGDKLAYVGNATPEGMKHLFGAALARVVDFTGHDA